ncbi:hypothetical protein LshimejAT787_0304880 [Lyophyllum shimeji]|uniref:Uncharacterized protein n=1 Tax=Lyophyllum shimeji TaxID=47721 RepID=A0A9P3PHS6_LYOSH|nr:hypothetical protein LshimejAT787_0304880 [Lyophyllum shimeji]
MVALEVIAETGPRSPSPVVPGAWPSSPGVSHKRYNTFPGHTGVPPVDTMHLDHVRNFHQRLSRTLFKSVEPSGAPRRPLESMESRSVLSDIASTPSDGSDFTRFTQHDTNTSLSMFAETSFDTACSSPTRGRIDFPVYRRSNDSDIQHVTTGEGSRIQLHRRTKARSLSPSDNRAIEASQSASQSLHPPSQLSARPQSPRFTISTSHSGASPATRPSPDLVSAISSSSPTSSGHAPVPSYHGQQYSPSLELLSSPSWETSFSSHLSEMGSSWAETPPVTVARPARMLRRVRLGPTSETGDHEQNESSTEVDIPVIPMLTALSLPGSVDTSLDISHRGSLGHGYHLLPTLQYSPDTSNTQISPSCSLFSPLAGNSEDNGTADIRAPSPSASLSPFITAPSSASPAIPSTTADSSAVEYAAAVVSSAWGEDISVHAVYPGAESPGDVVFSSRLGTPHDLILDPVRSGRPSINLMLASKMKKFSQKLKRFLNIRALYSETPNSRFDESALRAYATHERTSEHLAASAILSSPFEAQHFHDLPAEQSFVDIEGGFLSLPLPLPPGLASPSESQNVRRSLAAESQASASVSPRLARHSIDHLTPRANNGSTLEIKARPKTLAEIKSKRRFSLPGWSSFGRTTSQPSSAMVAVATTRPRRTSTVILSAASSSSIADEDTVQVGAEGASVPVLRRSPVPRQQQSSLATGVPTPDLVADNSIAHKKKTRRFSLSVLSNLVSSTIRVNKPC